MKTFEPPTEPQLCPPQTEPSKTLPMERQRCDHCGCWLPEDFGRWIIGTVYTPEPLSHVVIGFYCSPECDAQAWEGAHPSIIAGDERLVAALARGEVPRG